MFEAGEAGEMGEVVIGNGVARECQLLESGQLLEIRQAAARQRRAREKKTLEMGEAADVGHQGAVRVACEELDLHDVSE